MTKEWWQHKWRRFLDWPDGDTWQTLWVDEPRPWPRVYGHSWPDKGCTCTSCAAKLAHLSGNGSAFPPNGIYYDNPRNGFERLARSSFRKSARGR